MADQASSNITINAPKSDVMAVIADFDAYPQWSGQIKKVSIDETGADGRAKQVTFSLDAGVIKDDYTLAYTWHGDDRVDWTLVKSKALKSQVGSYILDAAGDTTEVHAARRALETVVLSTDPAHSREDAFGVPLGHEPTEIEVSLYGQQVDPQRAFEDSWREVQHYRREVLEQGGVDPLEAEEL